MQALSFAVGICFVFGSPARLALRPLVIPAGSETEGNSLLVLGERATLLVGPALAGPIVALWGLDWLFAIEALTALCAALLMRRIPPAPPHRRADLGDAARGSSSDRRRRRIRAALAALPRAYRGNVSALLAIVRGDRMLAALTATAFGYVAALGAGKTLLAAYAVEQFPGTSGMLGFLLAAMGAGGAVGALLAGRAGRLHPGRLYLVGNLLEALCWLALPLLGTIPGALALMVLVGIFESLATVVFFAEVQRRLADRFSGRFWATLLPLSDAFLMAGTVVGAPAVAAFGVGWAAAGLALLIGLPVVALTRVLWSSRPLIAN